MSDGGEGWDRVENGNGEEKNSRKSPTENKTPANTTENYKTEEDEKIKSMQDTKNDVKSPKLEDAEIAPLTENNNCQINGEKKDETKENEKKETELRKL